MKLIINQNILSNSLSKVQNAVSLKEDREIFKNILFELKENVLKFTATNQEIVISTKIKVKNSQDGITTIPARELIPIIKELPNQEITFETDKNEMTIISCGKIKYNIQGLPAEDFPSFNNNIEETRSFNFKVSRLKRMINSVSYAMGTDRTRVVICGLLFSIIEKTFTIVSTDGKRLSLIENVIDNNENLNGDSIIPSKSIQELRKLLISDGNIDISLGKVSAIFKIGPTLFKTNLIEGNYPDYRSIIPTNFDYEVKVNRDIIVKAIQRVSLILILNNSANSVKLNIKSNLINITASLNSNLSEEEISAKSNCDKEIIIALNPRYIQQVLECQSKDELTINFTDKDKSLSIGGDEGFLGIVMPMRS